MKSNKEYVAESDQRKRAQGFTKLTVWIPNNMDSKQKVKSVAERECARLIKT